MKIIDEKGKLFKKINVIDFLVILFLFCFIPVFYFSFKLFTKEEKPKEYIDIEVNCNFIKIRPEVLKLIAIGDREIDDKGAVIDEIIWLGEPKPYRYKFNIGGDIIITKEDSELKEIYAKVKLKAEIKDNFLYYKDKKVMLDSPIDFKTDRYTIAMAPFIEKKPIQKKWVLVQVKFSGVIPELAKVVVEGDTEKDPEGEVMGKLERIISSKLSDILMLTKNKWITINHPFNKDILLIINLLCTEKEGILYFKNYPVKIGNSITFTTDLYSISGTIVGLEIK